MRTTVTLQPDVAAAVAKVQKERGVGVSEAVNDLIRRGLAHKDTRHAFVQRTSPLGLRIDVTDVSGALDLLDGPAHR